MATLFRSANPIALPNFVQVPGALPAVGMLSLQPLQPMPSDTMGEDDFAELQSVAAEPQVDVPPSTMVQQQRSAVTQPVIVGEGTMATRQRPTQAPGQTVATATQVTVPPAGRTTSIQTSVQTEDPRQTELRRLMDLHENQGGNLQRPPTLVTNEQPKQPKTNVSTDFIPSQVAAGSVGEQDRSSTSVMPARQISRQTVQPTSPAPARAMPVTIGAQRRQADPIRQVSPLVGRQPLRTEGASIRKRQEKTTPLSELARGSERINSQRPTLSPGVASPTATVIKTGDSTQQTRKGGEDNQPGKTDVLQTATSHPAIQNPGSGRIDDALQVPETDVIDPTRDLATKEATAIDQTFERQSLEAAVRVQPAYFSQPAKAAVLQRKEMRTATPDDAAMPPETEAKLRETLGRIPPRENSEMGIELILPRRPRPQPPQPSAQPVVQNTHETIQRANYESVEAEQTLLKKTAIPENTKGNEPISTLSSARSTVKPEAYLSTADPNLLQLLSMRPPSTNIVLGDKPQPVATQLVAVPGSDSGYGQTREMRDAAATKSVQQQIIQPFRANDLLADNDPSVNSKRESIEDQTSDYRYGNTGDADNPQTEGTQSDFTATDGSSKARPGVDRVIANTVANKSIEQSSTTQNPLQRMPEETPKPENTVQNGEQSQIAAPKERESKERPIDVMALAQEVYGQLKQLLWIERERLGK